jgi:outer membrane protein
MNKKLNITSLLLLISFLGVGAQPKDTNVWTLQKCINYALQENIQVKKSYNTNDINEVYLKQAQQNRLPTLSASASQSMVWGKNQNLLTGNYGNFVKSNNASYGINSNTVVFNGFKLINNLKQERLSLDAGKYDSETTMESISLSVLNAYLQVMYSNEQLKNSQKQVESTEQQLNLADERLKLGVIAKSDYLQVKSQLASEKYNLASAQNQLAINKVTLMQLLELPVNNNFNVYTPDFGNSVNQNRNPSPDSVYAIALGIKPQIKSAELNKQNAELGVKIAKADYIPSLTFSAGLNTGYETDFINNFSYDYQVQNKLNPTLALKLSIPIYQNRQVKTKVEVAKINISNAELDETNTKNELRKSIEQACVDVVSAENQYNASLEEFNAANESYLVSAEKFNQGAINSVDFLIQKTNLVSAESNLLQAKYNLIFSYKTLDFYTGKPLTL